MLHTHDRATVSDQFAELFQEIERSETYHIDAAKVELSEQIYQAMNRQGVSQAELARRLGKSRAYINKVLQGNVNFTVESLMKISRALRCRFEFRFMPESAKRALTKTKPLVGKLVRTRVKEAGSKSTNSVRRKLKEEKAD